MKKSTALIGGGALLLGAIAGGIALFSKKKMPSELTLDAFKKKGGFNKGEAKYKGKKYTGTIKHATENGAEYTLEYKDGRIVKSTISKVNEHRTALNFAERNVIEKTYAYADDGTKTITATNISNPDKTFKVSETVINPDKTASHTAFSAFGPIERHAIKNPDGTFSGTVRQYEIYSQGIITRDAKTGKGFKFESYKKEPGVITKTKTKKNNAVIRTKMKDGKVQSKSIETKFEDGSRNIEVQDSNGRIKKIILISRDGKKEVRELSWEPAFGFKMPECKDGRYRIADGNGDFKYFTKEGEKLIKSGGEWKTQAMIDEAKKAAEEANKKSEDLLRF